MLGKKERSQAFESWMYLSDLGFRWGAERFFSGYQLHCGLLVCFPTIQNCVLFPEMTQLS